MTGHDPSSLLPSLGQVGPHPGNLLTLKLLRTQVRPSLLSSHQALIGIVSAAHQLCVLARVP